MTGDQTKDYWRSLVTELRSLPSETEWVEFKGHMASPQDIGEYISALSNSAALEKKAYAYLIWGIDDETHDIVGTSFTPETYKKGNEELENWLLRLLTPRIYFKFQKIEYDDSKTVAILEISRASKQPVQFQGRNLSGSAHIRNGLKIIRKKRGLFGEFLIKPLLKSCLPYPISQTMMLLNL